MATDDKSRRVEVSDGDQAVAAAEVAEHTEETARTSLLPSSGHMPPGTRASLAGAVIYTPGRNPSRDSAAPLRPW